MDYLENDEHILKALLNAIVSKEQLVNSHYLFPDEHTIAE